MKKWKKNTQKKSMEHFWQTDGVIWKKNKTVLRFVTTVQCGLASVREVPPFAQGESATVCSFRALGKLAVS